MLQVVGFQFMAWGIVQGLGYLAFRFSVLGHSWGWGYLGLRA